MKWLCESFILFLPSILACTGLGQSKSQRISKSQHWFESYGNFVGCGDFAYWWSCIGKGLLSAELPRLVYVRLSCIRVQREEFSRVRPYIWIRNSSLMCSPRTCLTQPDTWEKDGFSPTVRTVLDKCGKRLALHSQWNLLKCLNKITCSLIPIQY